jgi:hypothetical protein
MPVLDLKPDMMRLERRRIAITSLEGVMLWPDDEAKRSRAARASNAAAIVEVTELLAAVDDTPGPVSPSDLAITFGELAKAPPIEHVHEVSKPAFDHAMVAARILIDALNDYYTGKRRGLTWVKTNVRWQLAGTAHWPRLSMSTINNNIWRVYRPVASLLAASQLLCAGYHDAGVSTSFPCKAGDLARFLATAEFLRVAGEAYVLKQFGQPLLDPETTWSVSPDIELPTVDLQWPI